MMFVQRLSARFELWLALASAPLHYVVPILELETFANCSFGARLTPIKLANAV